MNEWRSYSFCWLTRETLCACRFQICLKGKVHIFKYLNIQACRTDKKPDTLDLPSLGKRCLPQPLTDRYWWLLNIFLIHLHTLCLYVFALWIMFDLFDLSMNTFLCIFPAWKIFIPIRTTGLTLELVVIMATRGCLQLRSEIRHCYCMMSIHSKYQSAPCGIWHVIFSKV